MFTKIKKFFFPPFSELEIVTLSYLFFIVVIENRDIVISYLTSEFLPQLTSFDLYNFIILSLIWVIMPVFFLFYLVIKLLQNAKSKKPMSFVDKKFFAGLFYVALMYLSITSAFSISYSSQHQWIRIVEIAFIFFILFRSLIMGISVAILKRAEMEHIYASQITDEQMSIKESIFVIILSTLIYTFLRQNHNLSSTLALSYFYVTYLVLLLRRIMKNPVILRFFN